MIEEQQPATGGPAPAVESVEDFYGWIVGGCNRWADGLHAIEQRDAAIRAAEREPLLARVAIWQQRAWYRWKLQFQERDRADALTERVRALEAERQRLWEALRDLSVASTTLPDAAETMRRRAASEAFPNAAADPPSDAVRVAERLRYALQTIDDRLSEHPETYADGWLYGVIQSALHEDPADPPEARQGAGGPG